MKFRLLSLNIEKGRFLDRVIEYIKKENFDIVLLQEVTGGLLQSDRLDCFEELLTRLPYKGELGISLRQKNRPDTFLGNAIFYNHDFEPKQFKIIWLRDFAESDDVQSVSWSKSPRNAISLTLLINGIKVTFVTTHLPWSLTPDDTPEKINAGDKLINYIKTIKTPFILTGDFNVTVHSQIIKELGILARNLTIEAAITNTLDMKLHKAKKQLPPLGIAVDFAFVSNDIKNTSASILKDEHLSDHLGQVVEFEI